MPYFLKEVKDGYKVCKVFEANKCFSNKPLTKDNAEKQIKAIGINEHSKIWNEVKKGMGKYKKGFFWDNVLKDDNIDAYDPVHNQWISVNEVLKGDGETKNDFKNELNKIGFDPKVYLQIAKTTAEENGYDPDDINFSDNRDSKLMIKDKHRNIHFGKVGYNDFIIWRYLEVKNEVEDGTANKKQKAYLARSSKIKGDWKNDKFSKNNLARKILWS